jgi:hypothetical protein
MEDAKSLLNQSNNLDSEVFCDKVHALASAAGWSEPVIIDRKRYSLQDRYGIAFQVLYLLLHKSRSYGAGDLKADEEKAVDKPTTAIVVTPKNDYYALLGVSSNATQEEIEVAYKQRSSALQTDVLENKLRAQGLSDNEIKIRLEQAQKEYQDLLTAYDSVGNTKNREHYDNFRNKYGQDKDRRGGSSSQTRHKAKGTAHDYEVLGLTPGASQLEIRSAQHRLILKYHRDAFYREVGKNKEEDLTPEELKEMNIRDEKFLEVQNAYDNVFDQEQLSREVAERDAKTQAQEELSNIVVKTTSDKPETDVSRKAQEDTKKFRRMVEEEGKTIVITPEETAEIIPLLPPNTTSTEASANTQTAIELFKRGVDPEQLSEKIDTAVTDKVLSEEEGVLMDRMNYHLATLKEEHEDLFKKLREAQRNPDVEIIRSTDLQVSTPNQLVLQPQGDGFLRPLFDKVVDFTKKKATKLLEKTGVTAAKNAAKQFATKALKEGGKKLIKLGSKIAAKAGITAAAQALGSTVPVIGNIVAFIITEVVPRLIGFIKKGISKILQFFTGKDDLKSQLKDLSGIALVASLAMGAIVPAIISGGIFLTTLSGSLIMGGIAGAFHALIAIATVIILSISAPIIISTLIFIFLVIFIIMIINNSAFVVPYGGFPTSQGFARSLYIGVTKTASPSSFDNPPPSRTVEYTITITARLSDITGVSSTYSCYAYTPDGRVDCPANPQLQQELEAIPETITRDEPYTFTYQATYDSSFVDSIITDTIIIRANTDGGADQEQGTASVIIGNPPTGCFVISDASIPWSTRENLRANLQAAINQLVANHPIFVARVCADGEVPLCYDPERVSLWGYHVHEPDCDILFSEGGLTNVQNAIYILTHEVSHHLQYVEPLLQQEYEASPAISEISGGSYICTYSSTQNNPREGFAEGNALYVQLPTFWTNYCGAGQTFQGLYPEHYHFARYSVFNEYE